MPRIKPWQTAALYAAVENWAEKYGCVAEMEAQMFAALPDLGLGQEQMQELEQVGWLGQISSSHSGHRSSGRRRTWEMAGTGAKRLIRFHGGTPPVR